ncbi:EsaB/YukD family protein [Mycobacterium sp. UM_Kg1]|uniref:EsaB/YukD family protein n=1 Tax=Mycobacterium sp. UM_Kg1 TaxID=1545691 RepID=UPI00061AA6FE|nr:EsaB/YukD family protein [Mycobacterium sp. UM_Kg1]
MSTPDSGLRRVAIYTDRAHADLALPSGVPVASLIPAVVDVLPPGADPPLLRPYRLCEPGKAALDGTKSLSQQGIRDGATLVLTYAPCPAPQVYCDDPAEQLATAVSVMQRPWTPGARRLSAALAASGLSGVAGFVAVPGGPGAPNLLLAFAAAGTVALLTVPPSGCGAPVRTMLCCLAGLTVLAAVAATAVALSGSGLARPAVVAAGAGVWLTRVADRVAAAATGLSRSPHAAVARAGQAHDLLTGLVAVASGLVVLGAAGVIAAAPVAGTPRAAGVLFAAAAGAALALRARSHSDGAHIAALVAGGTATLGIAMLGASFSGARQWPAGLAVALAAAALGFGATPASVSIRRGAEVLEGLALGSLAPLACWLLGLYSAARGLRVG